MKKIHRFIITLYFSPFLLTANDNTTHIVDGSSESSYAQPHYNEIVKNDARALNQDRDSFYTLESPSFIGTYSGGGAGNGRGLHILANEDFTIASLGIHANLNDEDFLARIYSSSSSSEISDLLYSIQGNPGVSGTMGWNDLNFVEYFSFEAGNYYYLEWSPADGGESDWCSQIDYYNDGGLPYDVGPLTMLDGVSGQYPGTFGNSFHPFLRLGLEPPVLGCTDSYAQNFNQDANADDGSCTYPDNGDYVLSFDGVDDYTHLDWDENMSTYTVSLWVKANILNQNQWKSFFNTHDGSSDGWQLDCDGSNSYRMQSALGEISIAPLTLDWAHIAIVADGSSTKAYFNGELVGTQSWVETDWNRIELGRNRNINNPGNYSVDQVSIWNIARTDTEVMSDMINELSGDEDGLLVYWKGDAGEGEVLYDHSGNAHHATINGATWSTDIPPTLFQPQTKEELQAAVDLWESDNATALSTYGPINDWDVSLITNMSDIFRDKTTFNDDIGNWDVSSVTTMARMFQGCRVFNQDISGWNVSSVTTMSSMFHDCWNFNTDISGWNVANVTSLQMMFEDARQFDQDISGWDISSSINMQGMFIRAFVFNRDISSWNVSNVTNMDYLFWSASNFDQDISEWDVSNVTTMVEMFELASVLSDENKCSIHNSFSINDNWPYDWSPLCLLLPSISVVPESLSEELYVGETSVHELTIYNEGDADLQWEAYGSFSNSSRVITNSEIFGSVFNGDSRLKLEDEIGRIIIPSPEDIFSSETIPYSGSRAQGISRINEGNRNQDLESILQDLDQNFESITDIIPQIYFFSEGITGYTIWDGGGDMYDGGNQLFTSTGSGLYYSDGQVISSDQLGDGGSYFTRKYDGLFVFVADINSNPYFEIRGNNGADNGGSVDGSVLETNINGRSFYGFVKRVYGAGDPSINHLFIVEASEGLSHDFTNYTDNDYHRINGLENSDRIYYLLYAGNGGYYIDDGYALLIMDAFLNAIDISPHWMELSESSGSISPGESSTIDLILDAADMDGGEYQGSVSIVSNDLEQPLLDIPVSLTVNVPYPHIIFDHEPLDVDLFIGDTASRDIVIGNDGLTDLNWSLSVLSTSRNLTSYTFTNCGSDGNTGPLQEDCESEYLDTSLEGVVTLNEGIQQWVVPQSGNYKIEVFGAQGGGVTNGGINAGLGSRMSGNFDLEQGEVLNILVGQMGIQESQYSGGYAGGGGGGSFITKAPHNTDESILIIAGGGGGSGTHEQGYDAIVETYNSQTGPEGQGGFEGGGYGEGNSGAGFYGNGLFGGHNGASIAYSYINGGLGGVGYYGGGTGYGGFGGGGSDGYADGGGGGGYSGGKTGSNLYGGWGGASFNSGEEQDNQPGLNEGHGYVVITLDSPEWISTSSSSGFIPVGEYDTVKVNYSAIGLEPGDYSSTVNIYSDDPDQAEVNLNTSLSVLSEVYFADISDASMLEDETLDIILESVYIDYEHSFSAFSNANSVEVIVDNDTLSLIPAPDWTGNANIEVQLTLNNNLAATVDFDLTVIPVNDKPYASNEIHNIEEDDILEIYLDAHDGDLLNGEDDEQGLTFTAMESFMHGSFSLERNTGMLSYAPNSDYFGPDSMTYLLMDDGTTNGEYDGLTDTGFVRINILPVNDSPVIQEIEDISMDEDTELVVDVMVSDVDNDDIVLSVTSLEEEVTVYIEDNAIHIIPYFNWYGATLITLYANDNMDRAVDVQEFIVTVLPVNDPPEFGELYALVGLGMDFEIPIYASDVDMDNLEITYDEFSEYPDWVSLNDQPYRLVGNAPIEGDFEIPLLLNDGYVTVRDTFKLESRNFHPEIISISDVPDDEGGSVYIEFERSFFDQPDVTNQFYTIFRSDTLQNDAVWVNVLNGVADGQENYIYSISTMFDSTTLGEGVTAFKVVASMNTGIFQSEIGLGYSVDNIAPETPTGLTATIVDDGISLSWNLSTAHDFQYFVLQKALTSQFLDFSEFMLLDTFYLDNDYEYNQPQYYRIMAKDHSGNSSNYSDAIEAAILALDDELLPEQYALHQNYPNPFNPVTKIRYELPENANVSIRIFDINGKVVKNINQGNQNPGKRYVLWDATNQAGESVSAGMYLYMIEAGDYISVKKMLFLK